jgi:hypothetical protein
MIWLTWRQFRIQVWVALGALALAAIVLGATDPHLAHVYRTGGLATCTADNCVSAQAAFFSAVKADSTYPALYFAGIGILYLTPILIGMFWGAPLIARELEAGTLRLAWTQSVTRTRWLSVKLGLAGLAAILTAGLLSLAVTWWASPIDQADALPGQAPYGGLPNRFLPLIFGARDIAPLGYAAFAFAVGVTAGVLVRRTLPAMAVTLAVLAAVQIAVPVAVRAHYHAPAHTTTAISITPDSDFGCASTATPWPSPWQSTSPAPGSPRSRPSTQPVTRPTRAHRTPAKTHRQPGGLRRRDQPTAPQGTCDLPASQPLLGLPVVRDERVRRGGRRTRRPVPASHPSHPPTVRGRESSSLPGGTPRGVPRRTPADVSAGRTTGTGVLDIDPPVDLSGTPEGRLQPEPTRTWIVLVYPNLESAHGDGARAGDDDDLREVGAGLAAAGRPVDLVQGDGEGKGTAPSF